MSLSNAGISSYGRAGFLIDGDARSSADLRALRSHLAQALPEADVVLGGGVVAVLDVDPTPSRAQEIAGLLTVPLEPAPPGALHEIGVVYDGIDLDEVSQRTGLSPRDVARLHASLDYEVELLGFLPGFAYLAELPSDLRLPRLATPRPRVAAGSVAIAERTTGIYPFDSPGGWRILGRAVEPRLFDPTRTPATRLLPGDRVRFVETPAEAAPVPPRIRARSTLEPGRAQLVVERVSGALTVQDTGRHGRRGAGIPPSGALDHELLGLTNAALGNAPGAAAIECWLGGAVVRAEGSLWVALDGEPKHLTNGESFEIAAGPRAVRYLAVDGGVQVPEVLGSRSTLLVARLGGYEGRALRPGDRLPVGTTSAAGPRAARSHAIAPLDAPVFVDPGPHAALLDGRFEQLLGRDFVVSPLSDRVGLRLEPGSVDGAPFELERPAPVVRGAVQLTPSGTLVVFGPDHPVTGGYPQLAVVRQESFAALAARRPGARVRFIVPGGS